MTLQPVTCPFCIEPSPNIVPSHEKLSLHSDGQEICSVVAYRCAKGHLFLVASAIVASQTPSREIFV
jgi:hypothetical protein